MVKVLVKRFGAVRPVGEMTGEGYAQDDVQGLVLWVWGNEVCDLLGWAAWLGMNREYANVLVLVGSLDERVGQDWVVCDGHTCGNERLRWSW